MYYSQFTRGPHGHLSLRFTTILDVALASPRIRRTNIHVDKVSNMVYSNLWNVFQLHVSLPLIIQNTFLELVQVELGIPSGLLVCDLLNRHYRLPTEHPKKCAQGSFFAMFVVVWVRYCQYHTYVSGLLHWYGDNDMIVPLIVKHPGKNMAK